MPDSPIAAGSGTTELPPATPPTSTELSLKDLGWSDYNVIGKAANSNAASNVKAANPPPAPAAPASSPAAPAGSSAVSLYSCSVAISYNGTILTAAVLAQVQEVIYREGIDSTGDTLTVQLADPTGIIRQTWDLEAGYTLSVTVTVKNWTGQSYNTNLGTFDINRLEIGTNKGGGSTVTLHSTSLPHWTNFKYTRYTTSWTGMPLSQVVGTIAARDGLSYSAGTNFKGSTDPMIERGDQTNESDSAFLERICKQYGFFPKIKNGTLWVMDKNALEAAAPVWTLVYPNPNAPGGFSATGGVPTGGLESADLSDCLDDIYGSYNTSSNDITQGQTDNGSATDPDNKNSPAQNSNDRQPVIDWTNPPTASPTPTLTSKLQPLWWAGKGIFPTALPGTIGAGPPASIAKLTANPQQTNNTNPTATASANNDAKNKLLDKNRKRKQHRVTIPMDLQAQSGQTGTLSQCAKSFDGKWILSAVEHKISKAGSNSELTLYRVPTLNGGTPSTAAASVSQAPTPSQGPVSGPGSPGSPIVDY